MKLNWYNTRQQLTHDLWPAVQCAACLLPVDLFNFWAHAHVALIHHWCVSAAHLSGLLLDVLTVVLLFGREPSTRWDVIWQYNDSDDSDHNCSTTFNHEEDAP
jgi:hypothetical protein